MSTDNGISARDELVMTKSNGKRSQEAPDPEVSSKAVRRRFTAEYKLSVLNEADACEPGSGEIGALLRREGLYSSHLANWRRQRESGELAGLSPKRRGRKPADPLERRVAELEREKKQLEHRLEQAEVIIDVQKKLSKLLGLDSSKTGHDESTP